MKKIFKIKSALINNSVDTTNKGKAKLIRLDDYRQNEIEQEEMLLVPVKCWKSIGKKLKKLRKVVYLIELLLAIIGQDHKEQAINIYIGNSITYNETINNTTINNTITNTYVNNYFGK